MKRIFITLILLAACFTQTGCFTAASALMNGMHAGRQSQAFKKRTGTIPFKHVPENELMASAVN